MKLVLATKNAGKVQEITNALGSLGIEIVSMKEVGFSEEIIEDGKTLEQNAVIKAKALASFSHEWTLGDDAGLFIDAVNGEPGIHVEDWAGVGASARQLIDFTLEKLSNVPETKRTAHFEAVMVLMHPNGSYRTFAGKVTGKIALQPHGELIDSQPLSSVFMPDGYLQTLSELPVTERNKISHRGLALEKVKTFLQNEVLKGNNV